VNDYQPIVDFSLALRYCVAVLLRLILPG